MDIAEYLLPERTNHPRVFRFNCVRRVEAVGNRWCEAASGVVLRISEDEDEIDVALSEEFAAELNQTTSDARPLVLRQDGEWRQYRTACRSLRANESQRRKKGVTCKFSLRLCNNGQEWLCTWIPEQTVDEDCLVILSECALVRV